jgi:hypothetical protein
LIAPPTLTAFPVVAIVPTMRKVGVACLDARLRPLRHRLRSVRKRTSQTAKLAAMCDEIERSARLHGATVLVLEAESGRRRAVTSVLRALADHGEALGMRVVRIRTNEAYARISGVLSALAAAERLAVRYDPVSCRVLDANRRLLRSFGRWREIRPLITAFALAHAFAVRSITGAVTRGPSAFTPDLAIPYDPGSSRAS